MKPKQLKSKLNVKRETVSNLNETQLDEARGGVIAPTFPTRCNTYCIEITCKCPTNCGSDWVCSC